MSDILIDMCIKSDHINRYCLLFCKHNHIIGRSTQILKSKQYNPLICDIKEGHKASTQTKFH